MAHTVNITSSFAAQRYGPYSGLMPFANASHLPHPFNDLQDAPTQPQVQQAVLQPPTVQHQQHHQQQQQQQQQHQLSDEQQRAVEASAAQRGGGNGFGGLVMGQSQMPKNPSQLPRQATTYYHHQPMAQLQAEHAHIAAQQSANPTQFGSGTGNGAAASGNAPAAAATSNRPSPRLHDRILQVGDILERKFVPPSSASERHMSFKLYGVYIGDHKVMYCLSKDDLLINSMPWLYPQVQQMCEFARVEVENFYDWRSAQHMSPNLDQWTRRSGPGIIKERIAKMRDSVRMRRLPLDKSMMGITNTDNLSEERKNDAEAVFHETYALWDSRKFACWIRYGTPFPYPYPYNSAEELQRNLRNLAGFLEELRTSASPNGPDAVSQMEPECMPSDAEALEEQF